MAKWYEVANEASFKQVADGYVFQSPNPWIFAFPRYYMVNSTQKAEIGVLLRRWRVLSLTGLAVTLELVASFVAFATLSPATFVRLVEPALHWGVGVFAALLALLMTVLLAPFVIGPHIYLNRALRRPLANALRTNERIKVSEQLTKIAAPASGKQLTISLAAGLVQMVAGALGLVNAYLENELTAGWITLFSVAVLSGAMLTAYFGYLLRLKAKLPRGS